MLWTSTAKKWFPPMSRIFTINSNTKLPMAVYRTTVLLCEIRPVNIITIPKPAEKIIAFISFNSTLDFKSHFANDHVHKSLCEIKNRLWIDPNDQDDYHQ